MVHVKPGGSLVEWTLEPVGFGTKVVLVRRGLPSDEVGNHEQGWMTMLSRLADAVASQSSPPVTPAGGTKGEADVHDPPRNLDQR